jgi:hypothetical protein
MSEKKDYYPDDYDEKYGNDPLLDEARERERKRNEKNVEVKPSDNSELKESDEPEINASIEGSLLTYIPTMLAMLGTVFLANFAWESDYEIVSVASFLIFLALVCIVTILNICVTNRIIKKVSDYYRNKYSLSPKASEGQGNDPLLNESEENETMTVDDDINPTFPVTVDYDCWPKNRWLKEAIKECKFDYVNQGITGKNFPISGKGKHPSIHSGQVKLDLELIHFDKKVMSSDQVLAEFKERGYRPATLPELLAFEENYPEEQRKYPIIALGSFWQYWDGRRCVPYLGRWFGGRGLILGWLEDNRSEGCRFLAVRES